MKNENMKYALVTGATSGIGKQIAIQLTRQGYKVIACGRNVSELLTLNAQYGMQLYPCDLSSVEGCRRLCCDMASKNITLVVNSAGVGTLGRFDRISDEKDAEAIQINVIATQIITKFFAKKMKRGVILNVCSAAAFSPEPLMATYAASKAYVYSFSRAADHELKRMKKPVCIHVLCPGGVDTPFNKKAGYSDKIKGMSAEKCARCAVNGIMKEKRVIIPDAKTKILRQISKIVPEDVVLNVQYAFQKNKLL